MNRDILIGTLLGDAWIQKVKLRRSSYCFAWQQSNKEYAVWKAEQTGLKFSQKTYGRFDKRTKKTYTTTHVHLTLPATTKKELFELFYTPKKEVSQAILDQLTPTAIAVWFMDDGNTYYNGRNCHITLSVNGFSKESNDKIVGYFKTNYGLNFRYTGKAIRIVSKKECEIFMNIVEPFIPECMNYKKLENAIRRYKERKETGLW